MTNHIRRLRTSFLPYIRQHDLAAKCGVDTSTVCRIERGDYSPTSELQAKIASVLGREVKEVFPDAP